MGLQLCVHVCVCVCVCVSMCVYKEVNSGKVGWERGSEEQEVWG